MERKLVKQGTSTMMVSLPSKWIKTNSLKKGDEVRIDEFEKNLLISAGGTGEKKAEISIKLAGLTESSLRTIITNTYRCGFDKVYINFEDNEQFNLLKSTIEKNLIGFEITKKQQESCIVENITEPSVEQFENILDKIFLNINELFEATKKRLEGNEEEYKDISDSIQKYDNFCRRIIIKRKSIEKNSEMFWNFLSSIIRAQRDLYFANQIIDKKIKFSQKVKELLLGCQKLWDLVIKTYKEKKMDYFQQIHNLEKELIYKKAYYLLETSKGKENIVIHQIASSIRQFYLASSPLAGLIM